MLFRSPNGIVVDFIDVDIEIATKTFEKEDAESLLKYYREDLHDYEKELVIITIMVITSGLIIGNFYEEKKKVYRLNLKFMDKTLDLYNPSPTIPDNAIVLTLHGTAFLIPFLNPNARYIHLNSKIFTNIDSTLFTKQKLNEITKLINNNKDSIYFISKSTYKSADQYQIANIKRIIDRKKLIPKETLISEYRASLYEIDKLGIDKQPEYCNRIFVNYFQYNFYLCKMKLKNN